MTAKKTDLQINREAIDAIREAREGFKYRGESPALERRLIDLLVEFEELAIAIVKSASDRTTIVRLIDLVDGMEQRLLVVEGHAA